MSMPGWMAMRSLTQDDSVKDRKLAPGTARRVAGLRPALPARDRRLPRPRRHRLGPRRRDPAAAQGAHRRGHHPAEPGGRHRARRSSWPRSPSPRALLTLVQRWFSSRIGEGLIYDLRTEVFAHVLRQPIAFFTRAQTGALVSRLNSDVIGAQQAFTSVLSSVVSNVVSLALIIATMATLSWQLTLASLALVPFFLIPARHHGPAAGRADPRADGPQRRHGHPHDRAVQRRRRPARQGLRRARAARTRSTPRAPAGVRDMGVRIAMNRSIFFVALTLVASLATAMVYGFGGLMAVNGTLTVGTLLALTALLARLYGPLTSLSNVRVDVMTALVSFERVFEVLDLQPLITERPGRPAAPGGPGPRRARPRRRSATPRPTRSRWPRWRPPPAATARAAGVVLKDVSFHVEPGQLVALVGPSGAGKTTITGLVARLYDPTTGAVRINGVDLRDATLESVPTTVGVVTQEAHLFHDTIRANLAYATPGATEAEMVTALQAAQVWALVALAAGGPRHRRRRPRAPPVRRREAAAGHRAAAAEGPRPHRPRRGDGAPRQRVRGRGAARPRHGALRGRTALVIAHRLSTVRGADQILVVDQRPHRRARHATTSCIAAGGLYADLYGTQFAEQETAPPTSRA